MLQDDAVDEMMKNAAKVLPRVYCSNNHAMVTPAVIPSRGAPALERVKGNRVLPRRPKIMTIKERERRLADVAGEWTGRW